MKKPLGFAISSDKEAQIYIKIDNGMFFLITCYY